VDIAATPGKALGATGACFGDEIGSGVAVNAGVRVGVIDGVGAGVSVAVGATVEVAVGIGVGVTITENIGVSAPRTGAPPTLSPA
jgi:hypothetical protein